jgi:hypothetical protein
MARIVFGSMAFFKRDDVVVSEWPVSSIAEGQAPLAEALRSIGNIG